MEEKCSVVLVVISIDQSVLDPNYPFPSGEVVSLGLRLYVSQYLLVLNDTVYICHKIELLWAKILHGHMNHY